MGNFTGRSNHRLGVGACQGEEHGHQTVFRLKDRKHRIGIAAGNVRPHLESPGRERCCIAQFRQQVATLFPFGHAEEEYILAGGILGSESAFTPDGCATMGEAH